MLVPSVKPCENESQVSRRVRSFRNNGLWERQRGLEVDQNASGTTIQAPGTPSAETGPMPISSRAARTTTAAAQAATPTTADRGQPSR